MNAASHLNVSVPCWLRLVFVFDFTTLSTVAYITRAWRLYFFYRQQAEKLALASGLPSPSGPLQSGNRLQQGEQRLDKCPNSVAPPGSRTNAFTSSLKHDARLAWFNDRKLLTIALGCSIPLVMIQTIPYLVIGKFDTVFSATNLSSCEETDISIYILACVMGTFLSSL